MIMVKVSVIIGVYNCADTLCEALDSLYSQTFKDFEMIMCDDGSTDGTWEVANRYAECYENFVLLRNAENLGLNKALNRCLAVAKGEYIARMDGDDISLPERFEKEVAFLDEHPEYAIVSCAMLHFDEMGVFYKGYLHKGEPEKKEFNYGSPFCHAPSMIRKDALMSVKGYGENDRLLRVEDYDLWVRLYLAGFRGYRIPEHLYAYRDDIKAAHRRTSRARINDIYAHWRALRMLDLNLVPFVKYSIKNLLLAIMPMWVYEKLRKIKYRNVVIE